MNDDTIMLLKECNAGCKYATNSIEQVMEFVSDDRFMAMIKEYNDKHIKIGDECHVMLNEIQKDEKEPKTLAKTFSWISTEVKLMMNDDSSKIADILLDGCHMGIKTICKNINHYTNASADSIAQAKRLVEVEQAFMIKLLDYV